MTRGSVRQWWEPRAHHCLGLHFWCKEYPGEPPSAKREKRFTVPRAPPPAPPAPTRRPRGERQPNESQRNFSTSMAHVPVWTWVMQPFICECKGPPRTEERPKPALDCDSKTTGHLTLPMLSVSHCLLQLGPGQTPLDAMRRGRPPKCLGRWGNCPLLAAFPTAS